jgi:hypothetical protein
VRAMVSSRARSVFQQPVGRPPVGSCQRLLGAAVASRQIEVSGRRRVDGCLAAVPRPCSPFPTGLRRIACGFDQHGRIQRGVVALDTRRAFNAGSRCSSSGGGL